MSGKGFRLKRNRRAGVENLWHKTIRDENGTITTVPSAYHGRGSRWRLICRQRRSRTHQTVPDQSAGPDVAGQADLGDSAWAS